MKSSDPGTPDNQNLRHFAWVLALILAIAARYADPTTRVILTFVAAVIFAVGTVLPRRFVWPYRLLLLGFYPLIWLATTIFPGAAKLRFLKSKRTKSRQSMRPA